MSRLPPRSTGRLRSTGQWALAVLVLLVLPLPVVLVWMLVDGLTAWSWREAVRMAGFSYGFELLCLAVALLRPDPGHDDQDG